MKKKTVALLLACVMALGVAIGGTMAWLTDKTPEVTNTFTIGNIDIDLVETGMDDNGDKAYSFVPGETLKKDPIVKVKEGSEDCYLFIHVVDSNNADVPVLNDKGEATRTTEKVLQYTIADGWEDVPNHSGYWYKVIQNVPAEIDGDYQTYQVLANDQVKVSQYITKDMADGTHDTVKLNTPPTITFTAAAVQYYEDRGANDPFTVEEAFAKAWPTT